MLSGYSDFEDDSVSESSLEPAGAAIQALEKLRSRIVAILEKLAVRCFRKKNSSRRFPGCEEMET
jgi:hypothetical protein